MACSFQMAIKYYANFLFIYYHSLLFILYLVAYLAALTKLCACAHHAAICTAADNFKSCTLALQKNVHSLFFKIPKNVNFVHKNASC
jgi:hypothetical protein